jgi:alkylated DNA repair dioxygenase AlkB
MVFGMNLSSVKGLSHLPDFVTPEQEAELIRHIDGSPWITDLRRRVQHFGYRYDYKGRSVDRSMRLGPLPGWSSQVVRLLLDRRLIPQQPDQLIVNEYHPGQGIAPHVDCVPCFTDTIVSLSLGSACVMDFTHKMTRETLSLLIEPRSVLVMTGEARYDWRHGIVSRKSDTWEGGRIPRGRRLSLTYRNVILPPATSV